nr:bifunctional metallophosphatase/5'-nucleotidase [uncultured Arsenicibacter sp.]
MKHKYSLIFLVVTLWLTGCRTSQPVTFLHINDVYEITPLDNGAIGGMARVATVNQQLKKQNPQTYFFHAGDFLSPSVIGTLKDNGKTIRGKQMVEVMNVSGVQYATFGNHEFDLDDNQPANLQERINESAFQWLVSNAKQKQGADYVPFHKDHNGKQELFPTSIILNTPAARIGVLAVTIPVNKPYVQITDPIEAAKQEYARLKPNCDFVVALTHINAVDDKRLAEALPELKLIMGGHDHDNMRIPVGSLTVCKADANAKTAYIHRLMINKRTKKVKVVSELKTIDRSIPDEPATAQVVQKWQQIADKSFRDMGFNQTEVVTVATEPWDGREASVRNQTTVLTDLIAKAIHAAGPDADVALYNGGSIRVDDVLKGNVTQYDIVRILPFGGEIQTVSMTGDLLKQVLTTGRQNKGRGGFLHYDGAQYNENSQTWMVKGQPIEPAKIYKVDISDFLMTGKEFGMSFLTPENPGVKGIEKADKANPNDLRSDIRKAFIGYFKK